MSFIEKNKAWLLPLLGLGVLGVGYMNFRTIQEDKGAVAEPASPVAESPEPGPSVAETVPAGQATTGPEGDLWADLQGFAVVPETLSDGNRLKDRARVALQLEQGNDARLVLEKPAWSGLSTGVPKSRAASPEASAEFGQPPELEFLIHGSQGSLAWFAGRAYRAGEHLEQGDYTVRRIGPAFVELSSPEGKVVVFTNPFHATESTQGKHLEAP